MRQLKWPFKKSQAVQAQRENDKFLKTVNENIKKIIKEQVKEQVKVQVSKILPRIKQTVNKQLKAEVLARSSHSSRTSYAVAADLSEMELKKILIENMEGNKPDRVSKRRRKEKEPESASAPTKTATRSAGRSTQGSKSRQASASEFALAEDPMQTTSQIEEPSHLSLTQWIEDLVPRTMWIEEQIGFDKYALWGVSHWGHKRQQLYGFAVNQESAHDVDGTLTDVYTTLDDRLKGIQMQYLTQSIWRKSDKDRAAAMIQAIDKRLKTKRIMKSLKRFVEGRLYEGDFRMLQRTI
nr:hypothetical protein [Tanacetum cinerariifolium]